MNAVAEDLMIFLNSEVLVDCFVKGVCKPPEDLDRLEQVNFILFFDILGAR